MKIIQSHTYKSTWGSPSASTQASIKAILDPYVNVALGDTATERVIRAWIYQNTYYTGQNVPDLRYSEFPSYILAWREANKAANGGFGPEMSCGTISALYVGMLAAYGIAARRCYGSSYDDGQCDIAAEWFDVSRGKWVFVVPHGNFCIRERNTGLAVSLLEWASVERETGNRADYYVVDGPAQSYHLHRPGDWTHYSGLPMVSAGNYPIATEDMAAPYGTWFMVQFMPTFGAALNNTSPADNSKVTDSLDDVLVTPNLIEAAIQSAGRFIRVQLSNSMAGGCNYQVQRYGTDWRPVAADFMAIPPFQARGVGKAGNLSNLLAWTTAA